MSELAPYLNQIYHGDAFDFAAQLPANSIDCVVTSPPYFGLRDYGVEGQLGLEASPSAYVARLVALFDLIHKALKPSGSVWLNLGDSYSAGGNNNGQGSSTLNHGRGGNAYESGVNFKSREIHTGLPPKNLLMIPARVAIALQDYGWILRSEIIWHKPAPMPESVKDRPTKAHEMIYLLTKSPRYWYDQAANLAPFADDRMGNPMGVNNYASKAYTNSNAQSGLQSGVYNQDKTKLGANLRDVWTLPEQKLRLRDDISPEQRSHVISELLKRGLL